MNPSSPSPRPQRQQSAAGLIISIVAAILIAGWAIAAYAQSHQQVQVTTCNPVLQSCTETSYPVQSQQPYGG